MLIGIWDQHKGISATARPLAISIQWFPRTPRHRTACLQTFCMERVDP